MILDAMLFLEAIIASRHRHGHQCLGYPFPFAQNGNSYIADHRKDIYVHPEKILMSIQ